MSPEVQVSAILELTDLLKNELFPDVVAGALRLLAWQFLDADNVMRGTIVECLKHASLPDLSGREDVLAPLIRVLYSNDPVARALALQALGHVSRQLSDRHDVQFRVLECLSSSHSLEVQNALFCVEQLAALNERYARAALLRLSQMLQSDSSAPRFKVALLNLMGSLGQYSAALAAVAHDALVRFVSDGAAEEYVAVALSSLTRLARSTGHALPSQVALLWHHVQNNPNASVVLAALRGLGALSAAWPRHADFRAADALAKLSKEQNPTLQAGILAFVAILARRWYLDPSKTFDTRLVNKFLSSPHERVRLWALRALQGAALAFPAAAQQLFEHVKSVLQSNSVGDAFSKKKSPFLKACLSLCHPFVQKHSPNVPASVLELLCNIVLSKPLSPSEAFAILHCVSLGSSPQIVSASLKEKLSNVVVKGVSLSPEAFAAASIACIKGFPVVGADGQVVPDLLALFNNVLHAASSLKHWILYRVAKEAVIYGNHRVASALFSMLSAAQVADKYQNWLVFLSEMCMAECEAQAHRVISAACSWRRACVLLSASSPHAIVQGSANVAVQSVRRTTGMMFQNLFAKWRLQMIEASCGRKDLWLGLAKETERILSLFPGMDPRAAQFLRDAGACCAFVAGVEMPASTRFPGPQSFYISRLRAALTLNPSVSAYDVVEALHVAVSFFPREFFWTEPRVTVQLSVVKPKAPADVAEMQILNLPEMMHVITVDGVIKRNKELRPLFKVKEVELEVNVFFSTSEKASLMTRLLSCDRDISAFGRLISSQTYKTAQISSDAFSITTMCSFPEQPKTNHAISFRVFLLDEFGGRWEVDLESLTYSNLIQ